MATRGSGKSRKRTAKPRRRAKPVARAPRPDTDAGAEMVLALDERTVRLEVSPTLSGGDVDADWQGALSTGEEAVGGSVATPDQDVVDEIGRALGVEQASDAEVHTSDEILKGRDRHYWHLERDAAGGEEA